LFNYNSRANFSGQGWNHFVSHVFTTKNQANFTLPYYFLPISIKNGGMRVKYGAFPRNFSEKAIFVWLSAKIFWLCIIIWLFLAIMIFAIRINPEKIIELFFGMKNRFYEFLFNMVSIYMQLAVYLQPLLPPRCPTHLQLREEDNDANTATAGFSPLHGFK
jgi:hypothetical protein